MLTTKYISDLAQVPEKYGPSEGGKCFDFDLQVKVVQVFQIDSYTSEARFIDNSGQVWHLCFMHFWFKWLRQGQYVRIRGATLANHHKEYVQTIGLKPQSNILSLPYPCQLAQDMFFDDVNETKAFERTQLS